MDLFLAGYETTSNTLEFAILYMVLHPDIMARVQTEIDAVIGSNRFPVYGDKQMYEKSMHAWSITVQAKHKKITFHIL